MRPIEALRQAQTLAKNDPDLLVGGVLGTAATAAGYATLAAFGYGLFKLLSWAA